MARFDLKPSVVKLRDKNNKMCRKDIRNGPCKYKPCVERREKEIAERQILNKEEMLKSGKCFCGLTKEDWINYERI